MEELKNVLKLDIQKFAEPADPVTPPPAPTNNDGVVSFESQEIYQAEVDRVVDNRLARHNDSLAKSLGFEKYSKEAVETYVTDNTTMKGKITELETSATANKGILFDKDLEISTLKSGVKAENHTRVSKLVRAEMDSNTELDVTQALNIVLEDFPMFVATTTTETTKTPGVVVGVETTKVETPTTAKSYLDGKYGNSKYYKK